MEQIFEGIKTAISNITADQLVALMVAILAFSIAKDVVKEAASFALTVFGVLLVLYFAAPDLYYQVFQVAKDFVGGIAALANAA